MDPFAIGYYAIICALLAYSAPWLETSFRRLLLGLTTGLIAATILPFVKTIFL